MSRARRIGPLPAKPRPAAPPTYGMQPEQIEQPLVVLEEREDPDQPMVLGRIRGMRRIGMHDRLYAERLLSLAERNVATRYAIASELARLGLSPDPDEVRVWTAPHSRGSSAERYLDSLEAVQIANAILGKHGQALVYLVVCEGGDPADVYLRIWPGAKPVSPAVARSTIAGALSVHLQRLSEKWD